MQYHDNSQHATTRFSVEGLPPSLRHLSRWFPCHPDKRPAIPSWTNPSQLTDADAAAARVPAGGLLGLNTYGEAFTFIDMDQVFADEPFTGYQCLHSGAEPVVNALLAAGCYVSRSSSGYGLHAIVPRIAELDGHNISAPLGKCSHCGTDHSRIDSDGKKKIAKVEGWQNNAHFFALTGDKLVRSGDDCTTPAPASVVGFLVAAATLATKTTKSLDGNLPDYDAELTAEQQQDVQIAMDCLPAHMKRYMETGEVPDKYAGNSETIEAITAFWRSGSVTKETAFYALWQCEVTNDVAFKPVHNSTGRAQRAAEWLWFNNVETGYGWLDSTMAQETAAAVDNLVQLRVDLPHTAPPIQQPALDGAAPAAAERRHLLTPRDVVFVRSVGDFLNLKTLDMIKMKSLLASSSGATTEAGVRQLIHAGHIITVDRVVDDPTLPAGLHYTEENGEGHSFYNKFSPFRVAPAVSFIDDYSDPQCVSSLIELLGKVMPDPKAVEYWLDWWAFVLQRPQVKLNHHPLLYGMVGGEGKGEITGIFSSLFRQRYVSNGLGTDSLTKNFVDVIAHRKIGVFTEISVNGRRQGVDADSLLERLKQWLGAGRDGLEGEKKHEKSTHFNDACNFVLHTNDINGLRLNEAGMSRRVFPILTVHPYVSDRDLVDEDAKAISIQRFEGELKREVEHWRRPENAAVLLAYLLSRDVSGFSAGLAPYSTAMKRDMIEAAIEADPVTNAITEVWRACLDHPDIEIIEVGVFNQRVRDWIRAHSTSHAAGSDYSDKTINTRKTKKIPSSRRGQLKNMRGCPHYYACSDSITVGGEVLMYDKTKRGFSGLDRRKTEWQTEVEYKLKTAEKLTAPEVNFG